MATKRNDITPSLLQKLYLNEGFSIYQIGKTLKCNPSTINKRLHEYKIKIRHPLAKIDLDKEKLNRLYFSQKLSTYKIADLLGCSVKTVTNKMRKYHIVGRPIKKSPIDKQVLITLYKKERLSLKQIGKQYDMTASGILKRMKKSNIPRRSSWESNTGTKKPFNGNTKEKAYMIGFRLGDLGIRQSSKKTKMVLVGSNTTKKDQVILINNLFKKYSKIWISKPNSIGVMSVSTILHPSFNFLLPKKDRIEDWIMSNNKNMCAFTAGYVDAEGSFGIYNKRAKFKVGSYDKGILKQMNNWFRENKIVSIFRLESKKRVGQNKDFWQITVNEARSLLLLRKLIFTYMRHKKRRTNFEEVKQNIVSRLRSGTIRI